jgi:PAS domain S-box-containing protein
MSYESSISAVGPEAIYTAFFDALTSSSILLRANAPHYTIVAASAQHLRHGGVKKEDILGKSLFEVYPGNPTAESGKNSLKASLDHVIKYKEAHQLPMQRFDVANEEGVFIERYWQAENKPVLGPDGEVAFIIQTVDELTDHVKAEEQREVIKGMEQSYRLFKQVPFALHIFTGPDLVIEFANAPTLELWGRSEDVTGKRYLDVLPELKGQGYEAVMQEVMQTGKPRFFYEVPLSLNRPGKESVGFFNFIYHPYYKEDSASADSILIIAHEVTEQVLARKQASESEQTLALAIEIADLGVFNVDLKTGLATYSQQIANWFGLRKLSHSLKEILSRVLPEDQPMVSDTLQRSIEGENNGRHDFVYRVFHPGNNILHYLRSIGQVLTEDGVPLRITGIIQDETEQMLSRKRIENSQKELMALFDEAPVAIATMEAGEDLVFQTVNSFYCSLIGRQAKEVVGKPLLEALPELAGQGFDLLLKEVIRTGVPYNADEAPVEIKRNNGREIIYMNFTYQPQRNSQGKITGVLVVATEVTQQVLARLQIEEVVQDRTKELGEANEALVAANKELQRSNANLEEFAHAASHDLKEPVRKIHFFSSQLKEQLRDRINEQESRFFNRIENATERMGNLIDDLLLYSHVSHRPHETEPVDLNKKLQRVLEDLELDIVEKRAVIEVGKLPVVQGYERQLQQLFQNLISNALKYSKSNVPPRIIIEANIEEKNRRKYHIISVRDNGIGFDEQYSEKIFQMFMRLHGKSEYSGTGVGLSIVKKVVDNHDGLIQVESTVDEGSVFKIFLPV